MNNIQKTIDIDVPVEHFYALITNFERYSSFLSDVKDARIVRHEGNVWDVEFTIQLIRRMNYILRLEGTPNQGLTWSFLSGQAFKKNDGGWSLEDLDGKTRATYHVDIELTRFVPKAIASKLTLISLPSMLEQWKREAEGSL